MSGDGVRQKLAAILAADVAGYSRLMADDERATIATLDAYRAVFQEQIESHGGRVVDMAGDSVLALSDSATGAVEAAVAVQTALAEKNAALPDTRRMQFRIGVNSGDIQEKSDGTIYGDGVNVAARLEALADPGGIMVSETAYLQVRRTVQVGFTDAGRHSVKNIAEPVRAYRVTDAEQARALVTRRISPRIVAGFAAVALLLAAGVWLLIRDDTPAMVTADGTPTDDPVLAMPTGPSIAVLPFQNLSPDPEQDHFAVGLTENIVTGLSRFQDLRVIGRDSTQRYKDKPADVRDVGKDLSVRFVVVGSVQRSQETLRVTAKVLDASDASNLWSETYDRPLTARDTFEIQDEITQQIVASIGATYGVISRNLAKASHGAGTENIESYDCVLLADEYNLAITLETQAVARNCLETTIERDPGYAEAWAWLAELYLDDYAMEFNTVPNALDRGLDLALKAVSLDSASQRAQWVLSYAYFHKRDQALFLDAAEKALRLNPNNGYTIGTIGWALALAGEWERGVALIHKGVALNPYYPGWWMVSVSLNHYRLGEYNAALAEARAINMPGFTWMYITQAAALAELGRDEEAREVVAELVRQYPKYPSNVRDALANYIFSTALVDDLIGSLEKAGLFDESAAPDRPIIAVLPFDNLSGDSEQDYFADGLTEDIITRLAKFENHLVIGRNTTFQFKDKAVDIRDIGEELGAAYVVEGSVRRSGDTVRITAQLIDTGTGTHSWAETFDRDLNPSDLFAIQDEITRKIAATIGDPYGAVSMAETARLSARPPSSLASYECALRFYEYFRVYTANAHRVARDCLESVVEREPNYASGWSLLGEIYLEEVAFGINLVEESSLARAIDAIRRGLRLEPHDAAGHGRLSRALVYSGDASGAEKALREALGLRPDDVDVLANVADVYTLIGNHEASLRAWERTRKLNPYYPPFMNWYPARYHLANSNYSEAIYWLERNGMSDWYWTPGAIAAAHCLSGDMTAGKTALEEALRLNPEFADVFWSDVGFFNEGPAIDLFEDLAKGLRGCGLEIPPKPTDLS